LSGSLLSHPANNFICLGDVSLGRLSTGGSSASVCVSLLAIMGGLNECKQVRAVYAACDTDCGLQGGDTGH